MTPFDLRSKKTALTAALLVLALALAAFFAGRWNTRETPARPGEPDAAGKPAATAWLCPMGDVPPMPEPGDCPVCGMQLVPLYEERIAGAPASRIKLSAEAARRAGIAVAPVERRFVTKNVRLFGQIEYDPGYSSQVDAFTNGVIDKLYVRRTGEYIRPDQKLFDFYSAEIYSMELELLDIAREIPEYITDQLGHRTAAEQGWFGRQGAANTPMPEQRTGQVGRAPDNEELKRQITLQRKFATLRYRLRSYGLYDSDINDILRLNQPVGIISVRVPTLTSSVGGVVIENNAFQGRYVNAGTPLLTIADPNFIWASLQAFESDYAWLRFGQKVEFTTTARPGEVFTGRITQLDPIFDPKTRTFKIGVVYDDSRNLLRPSMLVQAKVQARITADGKVAAEKAPPDRAPLVIPATAALVTGERAVVYVAVPGEPDVFEGREVVLGPRADEDYIVLGGLVEGEKVVVNGNFKLDSELQIHAGPSMMNPQGLTRTPAPVDPDAKATEPSGPAFPEAEPHIFKGYGHEEGTGKEGMGEEGEHAKTPGSRGRGKGSWAPMGGDRPVRDLDKEAKPRPATPGTQGPHGMSGSPAAPSTPTPQSPAGGSGKPDAYPVPEPRPATPAPSRSSTPQSAADLPVLPDDPSQQVQPWFGQPPQPSAQPWSAGTPDDAMAPPDANPDPGEDPATEAGSTGHGPLRPAPPAGSPDSVPLAPGASAPSGS